MEVKQLFFREEVTLEAIQAFILEKNFTDPPTNANERLWGDPIFTSPGWVITWWETTSINLAEQIGLNEATERTSQTETLDI